MDDNNNKRLANESIVSTFIVGHALVSSLLASSAMVHKSFSSLGKTPRRNIKERINGVGCKVYSIKGRIDDAFPTRASPEVSYFHIVEQSGSWNLYRL